MKKIFIIALLFPLLSCFHKGDLSVFDSTSLASFAKVDSDTTILILKDFFPSISKIDSVRSNTLEVNRFTTFDTISVIKNANTKRVNQLTLYSNGNKGTLIVLDHTSVSKGDLKAITINNSSRSVSISIIGPKADFVVLWQNSIIDPFNVSTTKGKKSDEYTQIKVDIPHYASKMERSYIRVIAYSKDDISNDILIPISYGRVIDNISQLKRDDLHAQIMYSLMIDRFYDGNPANTRKLNDPQVLPIVDYFGGDLEGITKKVDEGFFNDLGVNTIWLSPITQNPNDAWGLYPDPKTKFSGYHGYWPIFLTKIDDRFGTEDDLRKLLDYSHSNNINVILDYVANHMHIDSPTLRENPDWTTPDTTPDGRPNFELWDEFRLTTWFDRHIPTLDLEREEVYMPMTDSALFWLENFKFDGFRHDATKHIPEVFWRTLTSKIRERISDRTIYQIGETYGSPMLIDSYVRNGMLDAQFDFNVYDSMIWSMINKDGSFKDVWNALSGSLRIYGYHNLMGYITGNHDRPRFISLAGGALLPDEDSKLAGWKREIGVGDSIAYSKLSLLHAFIMTIPGVPTIYYGDEYGEPGGNDPDNRKWMRFDGYNSKERETLNKLKRLTSLRRGSMALIYGDIFPLYISDDVLSFARIYMGETYIIALNKSDQTKVLELDLPISINSKVVNTIFGRLVMLDGNRARIEVDPNSFTIISSYK